MFNFIVLVVIWSFIIIVGFISLNAIYYLFKLIIMTFMDLVSLTFVGKTKYFDYYGHTIRRKRKQVGVMKNVEKFKERLMTLVNCVDATNKKYAIQRRINYEIVEQEKETKTHDKNEMEIYD